MTTYFTDDTVTLHHGDALAVLSSLPAASVDCIVTSPPYLGLRDYGVTGTDWPAVTYPPMHGLPVVDVPSMTCQLGHEPDPLAPFGGLFTVPLRALKLGRRGRAAELNPGYFLDGVKYLEAQDREAAMPSLFDLDDDLAS